MKIEPIKKHSAVPLSSWSAEVSAAFDYNPDAGVEFQTPAMQVPDDFQIGLIVGPSGSGKTTLLGNFGKEISYEWKEGAALLDNFSSASDATGRLMGAGLNSIPKWFLPFGCLSEGEKARARVARGLRNGSVFDEFTSSVHREVAKSMSRAVARTIRAQGLTGIVFATCHADIEDWLEPDWVIDTSIGRVRPRGCERRPEIRLEILPCGREAWAAFRDHHYLSGDLSKSSRCWIAVMDNEPVGFVGTLAFPNGNFKNGWREHRLVVLPDHQGLGIGMRISEAVGQIVLADGGRYFSKTAHPRMIDYRDRSPRWRGTSKNGKARPDYAPHLKTKEDRHKAHHATRVCGSHEYIGLKS